jgi:hypothetical protein
MLVLALEFSKVTATRSTHATTSDARIVKGERPLKAASPVMRYGPMGCSLKTEERGQTLIDRDRDWSVRAYAPEGMHGGS